MYLFLCPSLPISVSLLFSSSIAVYISTYLCVCLSLSLSLCLCLYLCLHLYLYLCLLLFVYLSIYLSIHPSIHLKGGKPARLLQKSWSSDSSKTMTFCETSWISYIGSVKNEAIPRDILQKWKVVCRADGLVPMRFVTFLLVHLSTVLRLHHSWKAAGQVDTATQKKSITRP